MKRRVVVTGMGAVSPIGNSVDELWQGIREHNAVGSMRSRISIRPTIRSSWPLRSRIWIWNSISASGI